MSVLATPALPAADVIDGGPGWTLLDSGPDLLKIAAKLGTPVPSRQSGPLLDVLVPVESEAAPAHSLSAAFGLAGFPWHTDGAHWQVPPRWLLMRADGDDGGDVATLVQPLSVLSDEHLLGEMRRATFTISRGRAAFLSTLLARAPDRRSEFLRLDPRVVHPASPLSRRVLASVEDTLSRHSPVRIEWAPGHVLILDNWHTAHAREPVRPGASKRVYTGS